MFPLALPEAGFGLRAPGSGLSAGAYRSLSANVTNAVQVLHEPSGERERFRLGMVAAHCRSPDLKPGAWSLEPSKTGELEAAAASIEHMG